jgi:alpha-L-fucosidase
MKFGFYLSPWDRNAKSYGDSPAYNRLYVAQLTELLTEYGRVDEVWFDGACGEGENGRKQEYDWKAILKCVEEHQPHAVTAIMGDDIRWVGNEGGVGRETEWSATMIAPGSYVDKVTENKRLGLEEMSTDIGSRELLAKANEAYWYPSEVDVSIRPGWFYHSEEDNKVRSLANLVNIYYRSVGSNSVLLLNIPPDQRGLIHKVDAERIKEFGTYIKQTFEKSYIANLNKPWSALAGESREFAVEEGATINTLLIQEDIAQGQRVESFVAEGMINGEWRELCSGTTIGYKRLLRFEECQPERLRITITQTRSTANIKSVGLYYAEPITE